MRSIVYRGTNEGDVRRPNVDRGGYPVAASTRGVDARSAAITDATTSILANEGWGALNASAVAREVGCTVATVRARATNRLDLARMAWQRRVGPRLVADLAYVGESADTLGRTGDTEPLALAWSRLARRTLEGDAAMELIVVANTNPDLAAVIDPDLVPLVNPESLTDPVARLQRLAPLGFALGLLIANRHPWAQDPDILAALETRTRSYANIEPAPGPPDDVDQYLTSVPVLDDDDPALNTLLLAAIALIAERGSDDVTVQEIAAAAGATEGLVFSRYPNKLALVADALHRHTVRMWESMADTGRRNAMRFGPATAGAAYDTQWLHPSRRQVRAINLEQARVSWHHTPLLMAGIERINVLRRTIGDLPGWGRRQLDLDFFLDFASGIGIMALARLAPPDTADLPWRSISTARAEILFAGPG